MLSLAIIQLLLLAAPFKLASGKLRDSSINVQNDDPDKQIYVKCIPTVAQSGIFNCIDGTCSTGVVLPYTGSCASYSGLKDNGGGNPNSYLTVLVSPCRDFSEFFLKFEVVNPFLGRPFFSLSVFHNGVTTRIPGYIDDETPLSEGEEVSIDIGLGYKRIVVRRASDSEDYKNWWLFVTNTVPKCSKPS